MGWWKTGSGQYMWDEMAVALAEEKNEMMKCGCTCWREICLCSSRRGGWNGRGLVWSVHGLFILFGWPWSFDPARWFSGGHAWVSFVKGKDGDLGLFIIGGGYRCFIPYVVGKANVGVGRCYVPKRVGTGGTVQKEAGVEKEADDEMIWVNFVRFKLYRLSSFSLVN